MVHQKQYITEWRQAAVACGRFRTESIVGNGTGEMSDLCDLSIDRGKAIPEVVASGLCLCRSPFY